MAKDICKTWELDDVSQACDDLDEDERGITTNGEQKTVIINESGVCKVMRQDIKGNLWFQAKDVCRILGHTDMSMMCEAG